MKVGLAIYGDLASKSGGYLYDRMLVDHLRRRGEEVKVVSVPGGCSTGWLINNVDPHLRRTMEDLDVDVMIEDGLCHHSFCLMNRQLRKNVSYPLVGLFHFLANRAEPDHGRAHRLEVVERRFISTLDGCIFNSAATAEAVRCMVPDCHGIIVRPGRDHIQPVDVVRERSGPLTILYVGNIVPDKGLEVLLKAMASLPSEKFRLEVAGPVVDPHYLMRLWSIIEQHSMHRSVRFWGWVPEEEREQLMRKADVLVVPSYYEGYGLVFVEAMACGLPAIAPVCGGAKEIIRHGREGFLVNPGDSASITMHLSQLEEDRSMWREMSRHALMRYEQLPTWKEEMGKIRDYLRSVRGQ